MPSQVLRPDHKSFQKIVYPWLQVSLMHAFEELDPLPTITYPYLPSAAKRPGLSFFLLGTRFYETFEARLLGVTGQDVMVCIWGSKAQDSETIGDAVLNYGLEWHPDDYIDRFITNLTVNRDQNEGPFPPPPKKEDGTEFGLEDLRVIAGDFHISEDRKRKYDQGGDDEFSPLKRGEDITSINEAQSMVHAEAKWNHPVDGERMVNLRERLGALQNLWNFLDNMDLRSDYGTPDRTLSDRSLAPNRFNDSGYVDAGTQYTNTGDSQLDNANAAINALQDLKDSLPHFPFGIVPRNMFDMLRPGLPDLGVYERVVLLNITKSK